MVRSAVSRAAGFLCITLLTATVAAAPSKDESNLARETARLEKTAAALQGERSVVKRLTRDFDITEEGLRALRERGLGYGEITIVLSLAQKLQGGVTDANIQKVIALRQGPPERGWSDVAKTLGSKLGATVSTVKKVNNEARREMKGEHEKQKKAPASPGAAPAGPQHPKAYSGEGKEMTRGTGAQ